MQIFIAYFLAPIHINPISEGRLGVPGNKGTWPKLKRNTGISGLIRGSGINLKKYTNKIPGNKGIFSRELGNKQKLKREQGNMYPLPLNDPRKAVVFLKKSIPYK